MPNSYGVTHHERITAEELLKRRAENPQSVKGAKIAPVRLGDKNLGGFIVKIKPRYPGLA